MHCLHSQAKLYSSTTSSSSNKQSLAPCGRPAPQYPCSALPLPAAGVSQARHAVTAAAAKSGPKGKSGAATGKGFGAAKPQKVVEEGCPCGSNQYYKVGWLRCSDVPHSLPAT
eukprot:GHRQ01027580.1.p1 GENE.GHRQ01027580.1~~GHRQ01027580.1.p1  ORF type:complete len:122 (-),score=34.66 GHRQ01027580.1:716-1054(-)